MLRSYDSFTAAEEENGESRILVGFHFRKAVEDGIVHGIRIGDRTVNGLPANGPLILLAYVP